MSEMVVVLTVSCLIETFDENEGEFSTETCLGKNARVATGEANKFLLITSFAKLLFGVPDGVSPREFLKK